MKRCEWCSSDELYIKYHDEEWGLPVFDDQKQFEFLVLESAQAGLSWFTILKKREHFRKAYKNFDTSKVANFNKKKIEELLQNPGIIRNRQKIEASVNNAKIFLELQGNYGSFCNYFWDFVDGSPIVNRGRKLSEIPAKAELSDLITRDLKNRGSKFLWSMHICRP